MGFVAPDVDIRVIDNKIVETPLEKHYPPDTAAAIFGSRTDRKINGERSRMSTIHLMTDP